MHPCLLVPADLARGNRLKILDKVAFEGFRSAPYQQLQAWVQAAGFMTSIDPKCPEWQ
jgi:hypothetical protein